MTDKQPLVKRVKELAAALEDSDVTELDLTENGTRIVLRRRTQPIVDVARPSSTPA